MALGEFKVKVDDDVKELWEDSLTIAKELGALWRRSVEKLRKGYDVKAGSHLWADYESDGEHVRVTFTAEQWKNYLTYAEQQS